MGGGIAKPGMDDDEIVMDGQSEVPLDAESLDGGEDIPSPLLEDRTHVPKDSEVQEEAPLLRASVERACKSKGFYLGLSKVQREKLDVELGDTVAVKDGDTGEVIGAYTVGYGAKDILGSPDKITANHIGEGQNVEVVKMDLINEMLSLSTNFDVESDSRHEKRSGTIQERWGELGFSGRSYIVVPTSVAKMCLKPNHMSPTSKPTILPIGLANVKVGGQVRELPIVPSGSEFGLTAGAAEDLQIPQNAGERIEVYVNSDGDLVIGGFPPSEGA